MATVPLSATIVRLKRNIPFHSDYQNTRWFTSRTSQTAWFHSRETAFESTNMTFQRDSGGNTYVAFPRPIDDLRDVDYLMFQNSQYNNKWFYCFVTRLEYANKQVTRVHFTLDVLQTWMFRSEERRVGKDERC